MGNKMLKLFLFPCTPFRIDLELQLKTKVSDVLRSNKNKEKYSFTRLLQAKIETVNEQRDARVRGRARLQPNY